MNTAVISIGSNIEPERNVPSAVEALESVGKIVRRSEFERTTPLGYTRQPEFVNGTVLVETDADRAELKKRLGEIEARHGRIRSTDPNGPRTIDLDIVVWNGVVVDDDVRQRDWLARMVREVCPDIEIETD